MPELFGIPIVFDDRCDPVQVETYPVEFTCKCDPPTLLWIVRSPQPGVQCSCRAVWPIQLSPLRG